MIERLKVEGLNGKIDCDLRFNPDLNILTGKNGSGKTTLLKLIWYLISGNIERLFKEMTFNNIYLETDRLKLIIQKKTKGDNIKRKDIFYSFDALIDGDATNRDVRYDVSEFSSYVEALNRRVVTVTGSSLFFPTFRRVEGGFSIGSPSSVINRRVYFGNDISLEETMRIFSDKISVERHSFVASISTQDIVRLITERYADVSETTNSLHSKLSANIIDRISDYSRNRNVHNYDNNPDSVLQAIEYQVDEVSTKRKELLRPFSLLSEITTQVFEKSIRITDSIVLGSSPDAIISDKLSAGEKQMLSFLCYNAFYSNSPIFIDEPELSLHTDWQRILFPSLLKQDTGNQFIIATHSPFIYSKFPDKELVLNQDRGE